MDNSSAGKRILFVCMGNICRSPAAECVLSALVQEAGIAGQIICDSAGTIDLHTGKAPDARMRRAGAMRGIEIKGAARQVTRQDLEDFDLILAMDTENMRDLQSLNRGESASARLKMFCDYCQSHSVRNVPDPYYGGDEGFDTVLDILQDGCKSLLEELTSEIKSTREP